MKDRFELSGPAFELTGYLEEGGEKLFIDVRRTDGDNLPLALDIIDALKQEVSEPLIDRSVVREIVKQLRTVSKVERRRVAKGYPPKPGRDGKLVFLKRKFDKKPHFDEEGAGAINLADLGLFENIREGDEVARIYAPLPGVEGMNALGQPVAAPTGQPVDIQPDKETIRSEAKDDRGTLSLFASVDGYCELEGKTLRIQQVLTVHSDLDYEFGALDFVGAVEVLGDVLPGFHIKAQQGVHVKGNVNRAQLRSQKGDVVVDGFYFGEGEGEVVTPGGFTARGIHKAEIDVGGNLLVKQEIHNCTIRAGGGVLASEANLVGGEIFVTEGMVVGELGSPEDVDTIVHVGSAWEMSREASLLLAQKEEHERILALLEAHLGPLKDNPGKIQGLPGQLKEKMGKLHQKYESVRESDRNLEEKIESAREAQEDCRSIVVSYVKAAYPGVVLEGRDESFRIRERLEGPAAIYFHCETNTFEVGDYVKEEDIGSQQGKDESGDSGIVPE